MIIGQDNPVTQTLAATIGQFVEADYIVLNEGFEDQLQNVTVKPEFVFVNLMDVNDPRMVVKVVRSYFDNCILVGIHAFDSDALIQEIYAMGYDRYLTVFNMATDLPTLLQHSNPSN